MPAAKRNRVGGAFLAVLLVLAGCSGGKSASSILSSSSSSPKLYVSIGDSYAAGFQPTSDDEGATTRNGFAYQVVSLARSRGHDFELVNFGCGGATTTSIVEAPGCAQLGPGGRTYEGQSQATAAKEFLRDNRGNVALITVSLGGNDIKGCALKLDPVKCVTEAAAEIKFNLSMLVNELRDAAGPDALIVGITYPDVVLGAWVLPIPGVQHIAKLSIAAFQDAFNPALKDAYESADGKFVDVTAASGAYGSLEETTTLEPYGEIPVPVAKVCQLTFFCQYRDIHPTNDGYALIAKLIAEQLPV